MITLQFYTRNRNGCKCSYKRLEHKRAKKETESEAFISSHTNKTYLRGKKWKNECWYHMKNGKEKWECWGWENVRNIGILVLMNSVYAVIIIIAALICLISLSFTVKSLGAFFFVSTHWDDANSQIWGMHLHIYLPNLCCSLFIAIVIIVINLDLPSLII